MKKNVRKSPSAVPAPKDEILPEYDFSRARPNKFAARYAAGSSVVVLDPDVAAFFPTAGDVNETLRAPTGIIKKRRQRRPASSPRAD